MKSNIIYVLVLSLILGLSACEQPENLISPYHYSVLPKPMNFVLVKIDTSSTKKIRVHLSWEYSDTTNLKNFEIQRSIKNLDNFRTVPPSTRSFTFVDSSISNLSDSLTSIFYRILPNGYKLDIKTGLQQPFVGPESDILKVEVPQIQ